MIGIFDSGFGGLTVLKKIVKQNPEFNYKYLGDNARVPYGSRSKEVIYNYTREALEYLFKHDCKLIILACNSASALALRKLQQEYLPKAYPDRRVLGVVRPIAEDVAEQGVKKVGVIGTTATVASNVYKIEIANLNSNIEVSQVATPLLVPFIEEAYNNKKVIETILEEYLEPLKKKKIERLVLACTHYPILINEIREVMGNTCTVKNPAEIVASKLNDYLYRHKEMGLKKGNGNVQYMTTDSAEKFSEIGGRIMEEEISVSKIIL